MYCTLADIEFIMDRAEIIRHTDDQGLGVVNTAVVNTIITSASALIDSYLATRYAVPLVNPPGVVRGLCVDISVYRIYARRSSAPEGVRVRYEDALSVLGKIASEKITLPSAIIQSAVVTRTQPRIFGRSTLDKMP